MIKIKQAQSILEYAILIAIVIAAVVVMQVYMKRGISGRLKDSSDKISGGESFSASNTATWQHSKMDENDKRHIIEVTAIDLNATKVASTLAPDAGAMDITSTSASYSASTSNGGATNSDSATKTDGAANEAFRADQLKSSSVSVADF